MIKILRYMKKREWALAGSAVVLILGQIYFELKLPDYMSSITVLIETPNSTTAQVWEIGLQMLGCTLASAALAIICGFCTARVAAGLSYSVRERLFNQVADFGQQEMLEFSIPSLITRTTNDITQIQMLVAMGLQIIIKAPVMAVWAIIKIVNKSWELSIITAGFVIALLAMMAFIIIVVVPRVRRVQKLTDDINLVARENLSGMNVVRAFNAEEYQNQKFDRASKALMKTQLFNQRAFAVMMPFVSFAMSALALVIYWVGAALINAIPAAEFTLRLTTFSNVVVFGTYASYVIMSLMMLVMIVMFLPAAQVSAQRINEVLHKEISIHEGTVSDARETGTVEFRDVSFRYPNAAKDVLSHVSFKVNQGETIAFIGSTGSGKTTLISLAARLYDATEGQILVDGVDVRNYTFDALYDRIGYITQKAILFSGSVKSNILFGQSRGTQDEKAVASAISLAQADEFVSKLPQGVDAPIDQGGANVSGGQKQRLSIARALARNPEILIFDDSFSALDYKTDRALRKGLDENLGHVTRMVVAQRIGTIRDADQIVVLDDGVVAGIGTHKELMKHCSVYREIALSQLSAEELES